MTGQRESRERDNMAAVDTAPCIVIIYNYKICAHVCMSLLLTRRVHRLCNAHNLHAACSVSITTGSDTTDCRYNCCMCVEEDFK